MVVAALWQDHWFILDNLTLMLVPDEASEYVPLLVLDDKGVRSYVVPADPVPLRGFRGEQSMFSWEH